MCSMLRRLRRVVAVPKLFVQSKINHIASSYISPNNRFLFFDCVQVVKDPLFELGITLCIVLNTLFLALEHHGMSESVRQALDIGNKVFTSIFTFECIVKLMALSKDFFLCGWNIFDLIIVSASLVDIIFELVDGLSVLRGLRLVCVHMRHSTL